MKSSARSVGRIKKRALYLSIVMFGLVLSAGWTSAATLNWYSGFSREVSERISATFMKQQPDIQVKIYRAGIEEILGKFYAEAKAGSVTSDVISGGIVPVDLREQGLLQPYITPNVKSMPEEQVKKASGSYTDGYWMPTGLCWIVIGHNTRLIPPEAAPKNYKDFLDPKYKGKTVFGDPRKTGTAMFTVYGLYKNYGWDYFKKLRGNDPLIVAGSGEANKYLVGGERPLYFPTTDRILLEMQKGEKVGVVWAKEGAIPMPMTTFIPKGAKNAPQAKIFMDYMTSKEGQTLFSKEHGFHPVRLDVPPPGDYPGIDKIKIIEMDFAWIANNKNLIKEEFWKCME